MVLERMTADLKPDDPTTAKLMGAMIIKEFMAQRVAPLQSRPRPLWKLVDGGDDLRLRPKALSDVELGMALRSLVGDDQGYSPDILVPLYRRPDGAKNAAAMPVFDGRGLVLPVPLEALAVKTLVVVSSSDSGREEEEDSVATLEGSGETSPSHKADLLRAFPDDDDVDCNALNAAISPTCRSTT